MNYIINKWALVRRGELAVTPETIEIHPDFLHTLSHEDFKTAFCQVGSMFHQIMTDISEAPERFAMPLYKESETRYGATEAQESRYAEREFIHNFHQTMQEMGYFHTHGGWNEGPGICYYDKESVMKRKGPYLFRILDWMGDLRLMLRVRNAEKCIDFYAGKDMPAEITEMFRYSDPGCGEHTSGNCKKGVGYSFEEELRWHCGCCNAPFWLHPQTENIKQYIKLVEIGERR